MPTCSKTTLARTVLIVLVAIPVATATSVHAQSEQYGLPLGRLCLSFSASEHVATADREPFEQFNFFLLARVDWADVGLDGHNGFNGMAAWEASVNAPAGLTVMGREILPATSINVGIGTDNYVVGTGSVYNVSRAHTTLVRFTAILMQDSPDDLVLTVGASTPSSFEGTQPGWLEARSSGECPAPHRTCKRAFAEWNTRLVINCRDEAECKVSTVSTSWGAVKSAF